MAHNQNEYLAFYFSNKINKDVISLKYTLEIVQGTLESANITKEEQDYAALELEKQKAELEALGGLKKDDDPVIDLEEDDPE